MRFISPRQAAWFSYRTRKQIVNNISSDFNRSEAKKQEIAAKEKKESSTSESAETTEPKEAKPANAEKTEKPKKESKKKNKSKKGKKVKEEKAEEDDDAHVKRGNKDVVYESSKEENVNEPDE